MAFWTIRSTSRRSTSPDRMAAVVSSWSRSRRVTGWLLGRRGFVDRRRARELRRWWGSGTGSRSTPRGGPGNRGGPGDRPRDPGGSAVARARVLLALCFLPLPLHRGLLVMLASASLGEDATLLDLLVEAAERALERLVLTHSDFGQTRFTSSGRGLAPASRARCPTAQGASRQPCVHEAHQAGRQAAGVYACSGWGSNRARVRR